MITLVIIYLALLRTPTPLPPVVPVVKIVTTLPPLFQGGGDECAGTTQICLAGDAELK